MSGSLKKARIFFGFFLLAILVWHFDFRKVVSEISHLDSFYFLSAAILILFFTILGAYNTYLLVNIEKKLSFLDFIPIYWMSWAAALVFPGQIGDMVTLSAIMKKHGLKISQTLGRSLADKLISFMLMLVFACWGIFSLPGVHFTSYWLLAMLPFAIFSLSYWWRVSLLRVFNGWQPRCADFLSRTFNEITTLTRRHPIRVTVNISLTVVKIILAGAAYWCIFQALGYAEGNFWRVVPLVAASSLVAYLPISFNGIGTVEVAGIALFSTIGLSEATVLSAYLTLRLLVVIVAWGPLFVWLVTNQLENSR
ncbi:MAG: flippase-like domain-containing protein [Gammaproteobacteria bacterium]|nr:flippase-like domain-containing protein [Gammaproteobacteria bacterium]